jgi:hypothetical protein
MVAAAVESRSPKIVRTLCDLVRYPSIVKADPRDAGPGEHNCQLYLKNRLETIGFTIDLRDPDGHALYAKYEGRPGANKGRTFEGRPNLGGVLKGSGGGRGPRLAVGRRTSAWTLVQMVGDPERFLDPAASIRNLRLSKGPRHEEHRDIVEDLQMRIERVVLKHHRHVPPLRREIVDPAAVDKDIARGDQFQAGQSAQG